MDAVELQQLIDEHYARIRRTAISLCGDPWEAEEIAQETFLAAMTTRNGMSGDAQPGAWLYGICVRIHRSRLRSLMRGVRRMTRWVVDNNKRESTELGESAIETDEWRNGIWKSVERLPLCQREVVVLRFAEELNIAEIAATLECPEGTVKSRLHHGLARLREWLDNEVVSEGLDDQPVRSELVAKTLNEGTV